MYRFVFSVCALGVMSGCELSPPVGGPCTYEESVVSGVVTGETGYNVTISGETGEFTVSKEYFPEDAPPVEGETYTFRRSLIASGTCTPEIYHLLDETGD